MPISLAEHCARMTTMPAGVAKVVCALAESATEIAGLIAHGAFDDGAPCSTGRNSDGDVQNPLDLHSHDIVMARLKGAGVRQVVSEESENIEILAPGGTLAVAIDPLDGSSNIACNIAVGTIFSILPAEDVAGSALGPFGGAGSRQLAAGFFVYGPQTVLVLTLGDGVDIFTLDPRTGDFRLTKPNVRIRESHNEFAINASNRRHWEPPVRFFIDECVSGAEGSFGANFNMRWVASLVAEAFRILSRGGVFLYPMDARAGYENGRLRLLYEAAPIAFVMEQAGGMASTGRTRILDLAASSLHQRVPLIFGSAENVKQIERMHREPESYSERSPLFARRGLFRN